MNNTQQQIISFRRKNMFLILISLITGFVGMTLGSAFGAEIFVFLFGFLGILSPALFILQKMYIKLEDVEKKSK